MKKIKAKTSIPCLKFSQNDKIKKKNLKPQKDVGRTELKLPRSGFILPISQIHQNFMYIERLPTITELVISPYLTISQQSLGFKKMSFVAGI